MNVQNAAFLLMVLEKLRTNQTEQYGYFLHALYSSFKMSKEQTAYGRAAKYKLYSLAGEHLNC